MTHRNKTPSEPGGPVAAEEDLAEPLIFGTEAYLSERYARAEGERLWAKVWQQVGRVEELPDVPNFQIGHAVNNALCYCARPYGYDPNKCIFEAAVYELFPKGHEPKTEWVYTSPDDPGWRSVLPQDFSNMAAVQQGMKSRGFTGVKPNPHRERSMANLHRNLAMYMGTGAPRKLK